MSEESKKAPENRKDSSVKAKRQSNGPLRADTETDPKESGTEKDTKSESFADILYDQITSVIGGSNPNQFFCMGLPGTLLDPKQYSYDIQNGQVKPAHVKANESKLADKLFDAAFMSGADNGKRLSSQYLTSLNMLMPKLNGKLFEAKTKLREVLMTPYPYNFGDGSTDTLTLEQVFYKLYSDYVAAKEAWTQKQLDQKAFLEEKYGDDSEEANIKKNDEFLDWYGTVAEAEELIVEEKLGKVLAVFSPGDMEIIAGILESGSGRELAEARTVLDNVGELNPDGGRVYPVTFYPEDWFTLLDTSFTPVDLLESPAALSQRLHVLEMQKNNITANINQFLQVIPDEEHVKTLKEKYDACEKTFKDSFKDCLTENTQFTVDMFKTVVDMIASNTKEGAAPNTESVPDSTISRVFGGIVDPEILSKVTSAISDHVKECIDAQQALVDSSGAAVDAALDYFKDQNMLQLRNMLTPLQKQLDEVNAEIAEQKQKILMSSAMQPTPTKSGGGENGDDEGGDEGKDVKYEKPDVSMVAPNKVPDRFTQILIDSAMSTVSNASSKSTSASQSSCGVSFFFGGYSSNSSHQAAVSNEMSDNESMEIQIGMSVAKVEIDREWFNPGVFMLTSDMYNTSSEHIAPDDTTSFYNGDAQKIQERLDKMNACVFPCYPTAFVIAKDVTIKFVSEKAISNSFAESVEDHSSKGGGFFIFSGSSSSASSSSNSASTATSSSNSVTVRFTAPQILGYYLEAVAPDKSSTISNNNNSNSDYISIFEFITAFQKMLDDHNAKYNKNILNG